MLSKGARGSIVGWGTMLPAGWSRVWFPMRSLDFSITSSFQPHYSPGVDSVWQKWVLGPGGKGRPARKADNLTAICEPIV
jgi:hypothetical protein